MSHPVNRPIVITTAAGSPSNDEILAQCIEQVAVAHAELGDRIVDGHVRTTVYRGIAARRWFGRDRPNGRHDDCTNPIRCTHHYDQGLAEIDHGGALIVLNFTVRD